MLQRAGQIEFGKAPATHLAAVSGIAQLLLGLAAGDGMRAARLEPAAVRHIGNRGHAARNRRQLAVAGA